MSKHSPQPKPMTPDAAARIHSAEGRRQGGQVKAGDFASRVQRAAARNSKLNGIQ